MATNKSKRSILWASELVQLVVPTAADVRWRHAHVTRIGAERTVCGFKIRYWWFRDKDVMTAGELCKKWSQETGDPNCHPHLHIQGTHLGGPLDITPSLCWNCFTLVTEGRRVQWGSSDDIDDFEEQYPAEYYWRDPPDNEA